MADEPWRLLTENPETCDHETLTGASTADGSYCRWWCAKCGSTQPAPPAPGVAGTGTCLDCDRVATRLAALEAVAAAARKRHRGHALAGGLRCEVCEAVAALDALEGGND